MTALVDTNVLVYRFDPSFKEEKDVKTAIGAARAKQAREPRKSKSTSAGA